MLTLGSSTESLSKKNERRILHTVTAQKAFQAPTHDFISSALRPVLAVDISSGMTILGANSHVRVGCIQ